MGSIRAREQVVIDGRDVLLTQVLRQFRMMTGKEMSPIIALETLGRTTNAAGVNSGKAAGEEATPELTTDTN